MHDTECPSKRLPECCPGFTPIEQELLSALHVPISSNEYSRIQALRNVKILDSTFLEEEVKCLTSLAARVFKVPIVTVSLLDVNRVWFLARVGFTDLETPRDFHLCNYVILDEAPHVFFVADLANDDTFKHNPCVCGPPHARFYAAVPLYSGGHKIATFCIADTEPHYDFDADKQSCLIEFAGLITEIIEAHRTSMTAADCDPPKLNTTLLSQLCSPLSTVNQQYNLLTRQTQVEDLQVVLESFQNAVDDLTSALEVSLRLGIGLITQRNSSHNSLSSGRRGLSLGGYMQELQKLTLCYGQPAQSSWLWSHYDSNTHEDDCEDSSSSGGRSRLLKILPRQELDLLATLISFLSLMSTPTQHDHQEQEEQHKKKSVNLSCQKTGRQHFGELTVTLTFTVSAGAVEEVKGKKQNYDLMFIEEMLRSIQGSLSSSDEQEQDEEEEEEEQQNGEKGSFLNVVTRRLCLIVPCRFES